MPMINKLIGSLSVLLLTTTSLYAPVQAEQAQGAFDLSAAPAAAPLSLDAGPAALAAPPQAATPFVIAPDSGTAAASPAPAAGTVDERALRYYASQGDVAHMAAEIKRLKAAYPGWSPPADLSASAAPAKDEKALWDLFAAGRFDEIRSRVAAMRAQDPNWRPSADFVAKFDQAQIRNALVSASDAGQWQVVLTLAGRDKALLVCSNVDAIWRVAEALAKLGDADRALSAYRYVLANCSNPGERYATVQKASMLLKPKALDSLIAMGQPKADGTGEFDGVRLDLMRDRIGKAAAKVAGTATPSAAELETFGEMARQAASAGDQQLLGWAYYSRGQFDEAATWFASALDLDNAAKSAEGLTLALRSQNKLAEAEALSLKWSSDPSMAKVYLETVTKSLLIEPVAPLSAERVQAFEAVLTTQRSAVAAQAYGWYLVKLEDSKAAAGWFARSLEWAPSQEAAVGLAVANIRLKNSAGLKAVIQAYQARYPQLADLGQMPAIVAKARIAKAKGVSNGKRGAGDGGATAEALALYKSGKMTEAVAALDRAKLRRAEPRDLSVLRGWALYQTGDWDKAKAVFKDLDSVKSTPETRKALNVIWVRTMPGQFR